MDIRLKSNPVLSATYTMEKVPLLYLVLSCFIVAVAVKAKLFYDARQVINNATYARTNQKDMWKHCDVKNVEAYLARRKILLQRRFESIGCQIISSQWNEVTEEPVLSSVVVMTVDTTNAVIKVRNDFVVLGICANHTAPQSVTITEIVRFTSKDSQSSSIDTLVRHVATDEKSVHFSDLCDD